MRARDVRALIFCAVSTVTVMVVSYLALRMFVVTLALTGGYLVWVFTRPRMIRLMRRVNDAPDWSGYFRNR